MTETETETRRDKERERDPVRKRDKDRDKQVKLARYPFLFLTWHTTRCDTTAGVGGTSNGTAPTTAMLDLTGAVTIFLVGNFLVAAMQTGNHMRGAAAAPRMQLARERGSNLHAGTTHDSKE